MMLWNGSFLLWIKPVSKEVKYKSQIIVSDLKCLLNHNKKHSSLYKTQSHIEFTSVYCNPLPKSSFTDPENFLAFLFSMCWNGNTLENEQSQWKPYFVQRSNLGKMCTFRDHQFICLSKMTTVLSSLIKQDIFLTSKTIYLVKKHVIEEMVTVFSWHHNVNNLACLR